MNRRVFLSTLIAPFIVPDDTINKASTLLSKAIAEQIDKVLVKEVNKVC